MDYDKTETLKKLDLYKIALETRNFEISLFWQRSNYFLVLNTAIAIGFFVKATEGYQVVLSLLGIVVSILWFAINQGSKFWQSRWETRLRIVEESISKEINFFSVDSQIIKKDVEESINSSKHSRVRKYFDRLVLIKPSVSFMMTLLSLTFIIFWFVVCCFSIFE